LGNISAKVVTTSREDFKGSYAILLGLLNIRLSSGSKKLSETSKFGFDGLAKNDEQIYYYKKIP